MAGPFNTDANAKLRSNRINYKVFYSFLYSLLCTSFADPNKLQNLLSTHIGMCICEFHGLLTTESNIIITASLFVLGILVVLIWLTLAIIKRICIRTS